MSSGVKMFLNQVVIDQCFPFVPDTKKTRALRKEFDKEVKRALRKKKHYTVKEMFDELEKM